MTLVVTAGEPGTGKTTQHVALCKMLPESIYLCMEVKDDKLLRIHEINHIKIVQYDHSYNEDPIGTLSDLEIAIHKIITDNKYKNVILDGISDIRKYARQGWARQGKARRGLAWPGTAWPGTARQGKVDISGSNRVYPIQSKPVKGE